jgi:cell division protein FtsB
MTMEDERNLDLMVAELEQENRLMRARNERLERENDQLRDENARFKVTLERIIAVSQLAFRNGRPQGTGEVGSQEHDDKASY